MYRESTRTRMLKAEEEASMASQSGLVDAVRGSLCLQSLLGFFFNKGVRGGPRVLLNLAGILLALIIFVKLLPQRMAEGALSAIPQSVWSSIGSQPDDNVAGGLRIVVFGENDIGTPVAMQPESDDAESWTQALCSELQCANYISMVPSPEAAPYSISSNELYAVGIDKVFNETHDRNTPGYDYSYVSEAYPPQWKSSDLKAQVDRFLAMPKPHHTSSETLWVFSFGMWDVWSLSSLPLSSGEESVKAMTKDVFAQIERLYVASMDPASIAYSDMRTIAQRPGGDEPQDSNETDETTEEQGQAGKEAGAPEEKEQEQQQQQQQQQQPEEVDREEGASELPEFFRIVVPRIVDPSVLPGWRDLRPESPAVHSKAEQMRNAYALTNAWNDGVVSALSDWVRKGNSQEGKEGNKARRAASASAAGTAAPTRDGYAYNLADYLLDAMLERQMRNARLADGNGRGRGALEEGFRDVRDACLRPLRSVAVSVATKSGVALNLPYEKIGGDKQALAPSPAAEAGVAVVVKRDGLGGGGGGDDDDDDNSAEAAAAAAAVQRPSLGYMSTAKVCDIPGDHLFYTPFALSQRAIQEIAAETADMIRNGETVKSKLGI